MLQIVADSFKSVWIYLVNFSVICPLRSTV